MGAKKQKKQSGRPFLLMPLPTTTRRYHYHYHHHRHYHHYFFFMCVCQCNDEQRYPPVSFFDVRIGIE